MLFAHLKRHAEGDVSVGILGDPNNSSRNFTFKLVFNCKVPWVGPSESKRQPEPLHAANSNVSTHLPRGLDDARRHDVCADHAQDVILPQLITELRIVVQISNIIWLLNKHSTVLLGLFPGEVGDGTNNKLDTSCVAPGLQNVKSLGEHALRHVELGTGLIVPVICETDRLSAAGCLVQKRSICDVKASELADHGLVVEQTFESALRDL